MRESRRTGCLGGLRTYLWTVVVCLAFPVVAQAQSAPLAYWERDAFDWLEPGPLAGRNGWGVSGGIGAQIVSQAPECNALAIDPLVGSAAGLVKPVVGPSGGLQRLRFRVRAEGSSLAGLNLESTSGAVLLGFELGSRLRAWSSSASPTTLLAATVAGHWYSVSARLNLDARRADISVDAGPNISLSLPVGTLSRLRLTGSDLPGAVYLADLFGFTPPTLAPTLAPSQPLDFGYYYADSRWGDYRSDVSSFTNLYRADPAAYTTDGGVRDWRAPLQQALFDAMRAGKRVLLALNQSRCPEIGDENCAFPIDEILDAAQPYWSFVDGLELADESGWDRGEIEARITDLRERLRARGLAAPPVGEVFAAEEILGGDGAQADGLSWVGIEAYVDPPGSGSSYLDRNVLAAFLYEARQRVPGARPLVYILQGYDRNGEWTNEDTLAELQSTAYEMARTDSRVRGIHVFSYGRCGGTHAYPGLQARHEAIGAAVASVNRPPAVSLTAPADGTQAAVGPVRLAAEASDPDGSVAGVDFYVGTELVGSVATRPFTMLWQAPRPGVYTVFARAWDNRHAAAVSAPSTLTLGTPPPLALSIDDASLDSRTSPAQLRFSVSLSTVSGVPVSVGYSTANGSAIAGVDYVATSGTLRFAPGTVSQPIVVAVPSHTRPVSTSFFVNLTSPVNATVGKAQGVGTIPDDGTTRTVCQVGCNYTRIQDAIDAFAGTTGRVVQINQGYSSSGSGEVFPIQTLAIPGSVTITGQLDGSGNPPVIAYTGPNDGEVLRVVSPGSMLRNLKIVPGNSSHVSRVIAAAAAGPSCLNNCHLNGLTIDSVAIDFTATFSAANGIDLIADDVTIKNSLVKGATGNAIHVDGDNYTIQNNVLNGFDLPGTVPTGILAIGFAADLKSATGNACTGFPTNYTITGNAISGYQEAALKWCLGRNTIVATNVISDILGTAIETSGSQRTLIQGNAIRWTLGGGTSGIGASSASGQQCDGTRIIGNRVTGRASPRDLQRGIVVQNCLNTTVAGNVVENLGGTESVIVTTPAGVSTRNTIQGNTVQNGNGTGIIYSGADTGTTAVDGGVVRDNVVLNHGKDGIVASNMKGAGNLIAYNIVHSNNLTADPKAHGFNMQGLSGTVFAANEALDTHGVGAAGFSFASSQNIAGNCNFGAGNAGGLLVQMNVSPVFVNTNSYCRYGLYDHFDFDGDGKSDPTVYRNTTGEWISRQSTNGAARIVAWGDPASDDIPAPGNYNSPTQTDVAVYRYPTGQWIIRNAGGGGFSVVAFGNPTSGDIPVPGKYTQTSLTEVAVFRSSTAEWFIKRADGGGFETYAWGCPSCADIPVPGDYDGDGKDDIAVYRRSSGEWYIRKSSDSTLMYLAWGSPVMGDLPVPGRYSTPGKTDIAVYRSLTGQWLIRNSLTGVARVLTWGTPSLGDVAVPADYSQAGLTDIGVYRLLTGDWLILRSTDGGVTTLRWGLPAALDSPLMAR